MNQPKICPHCLRKSHGELLDPGNEEFSIEYYSCKGASTVTWDADSYAAYLGYLDAQSGSTPETTCLNYMVGWDQGYEDHFGQRADWLNGEEL